MAKHFIFSFFFFVSAALVRGQNIGDYYVSISGDNSQGGRLKFLSDSTVELSSMPRHMSPSIKRVYKYIATDTTIKIFPELFRNCDSNAAGIYIQSFVFDTVISLTKIKGGFVDDNNSLVFVRQKDFGNNPDIAYKVDGKTYIQDMGVTDGYGLIRRYPKANKALQKRLRGLSKDNCIIEFVKGLNAYKRFGIERVYGVIVITTTK